jgi:ribosome biogenesis GTPase A
VPSFIDILITCGEEISLRNFIEGETYNNKMVLYRYFFYNFLVASALPDILTLSKSASKHHYIHRSIFNTLEHICIQFGQNKMINTEVESLFMDDLLREQGLTDQ